MTIAGYPARSQRCSFSLTIINCAASGDQLGPRPSAGHCQGRQGCGHRARESLSGIVGSRQSPPIHVSRRHQSNRFETHRGSRSIGGAAGVTGLSRGFWLDRFFSRHAAARPANTSGTLRPSSGQAQTARNSDPLRSEVSQYLVQCAPTKYICKETFAELSFKGSLKCSPNVRNQLSKLDLTRYVELAPAGTFLYGHMQVFFPGSKADEVPRQTIIESIMTPRHRLHAAPHPHNLCI